MRDDCGDGGSSHAQSLFKRPNFGFLNDLIVVVVGNFGIQMYIKAAAEQTNDSKTDDSWQE